MTWHKCLSVIAAFVLTLNTSALAEVESYGPLFSSNSNESISVFRYGGEVHWMAFYDRADASGYLGSAFYVNLTTGQSIAFPATCAGRYLNSGRSLIGSKLYAASGDPDHLCEFDLISKTWTDRGRYGVIPSDKFAYTRSGSDNRLYLGNAVRGTLERWDPARLAFDHYGPIDPPVWKIGMSSVAIQLQNITLSNGTATVKTGTAHRMPVGSKVKVTGALNASLNATFATTSNPTADSFAFSAPGVPNGIYQESTLVARNIDCAGCYRYISTFALSPDARYVYMAMRDAYVDRWWLVIRSTDPAVTAEKVCWEDNNFSGAEIAYGNDGQIYAKTTPGNLNYLLADGNCPTTPVTTSPTFRYWEFYQETLNSFSPDLVKTYFNFEVNYDDLFADSSNAGAPKLRYRPVGASTWIEKTGSVKIWPDLIKRISTFDSQRLLLVAGSYGPDAMFDLNTKQATILGRIGSQSTYASAYIAPYILFSGYPTVSYRADTRIPWNWSSSNNTLCTATTPSNPCMAVQSWGKYHYYSAKGSDGLFYVASTYNRQNGLGGEIGWYNPRTSEKGSYRAGTPSINCFSPHDFISLSASDGSQKFAYSGAANNGGEESCLESQGRLFIFDAATKTIVSNYSMLPGAGTAGRLVDVGDGSIVGVIREFPTAGKYTAYKTRISTGEVLLRKEFTGTLQPEFDLTRGPDGMVYYPLIRTIYKLTPSDGSNIAVGETLPISATEITRLQFVGRDLWFTSGSSLKVLRNLAPLTSAPMSPENLRLASGS